MNKDIILVDLGINDYNDTWFFQESIFNEILKIKLENKNSTKEKYSNTENYFLFVEHPHVYTLGKTGDMKNLLLTQKELEDKGVTFYKVNRGGDITYHGPGQVVGYPIFDLDNFFNDMHKYLRLLEEVIISTIGDYGLKGERSSGETGVWLDVNTPFARKICAIGIRVSQWITMHGFALNVNTNLNYFNYIVPCGINNKGVTSLQQELGKNIQVEEVKLKIMKYFMKKFEITNIFNSVKTRNK